MLFTTHVVFDDGVSAIKPACVTEPFKNTLCGMPLLAWPPFVFHQPLINLVDMSIQLWALDCSRPPISRRLRLAQHLRYTMSADPKITNDPTPAQPILKTGATHLHIQFHGENPQSLPSNERTKVAGLYAARVSTTPPLPWPSIGPPITYCPNRQDRTYPQGLGNMSALSRLSKVTTSVSLRRQTAHCSARLLKDDRVKTR